MRIADFVVLTGFLFPAHSHVLDFYDGLTTDYLNWRDAFMDEEDPIAEFANSKKGNLCDIFLFADTYVYVEDVSTDSSFLLAHSLTKIETENYHYKKRAITIDSKIKATRVFLCAEDLNYNYYLTYGYGQDITFVAKAPKNEGDTKLIALLLSDPRVEDVSYEDESTLNSSFLENLGYNEPGPDQLYYSLQLEEAPTKKLQINYIYKTPSDRCVTRPLNFFDKSTTLKVESEVLPCAINRDWSNPQFYLLRANGVDLRTSVFVLAARKDGILFLIKRIDNVTYLMMQ